MVLSYFNPRSPRGERPEIPQNCGADQSISIHAPREGSDARTGGNRTRSHGISIHAPREGSDQDKKGKWFFVLISIHAPREGSDLRLRR